MSNELLSRHTQPFLLGCYLATNAVPDAYLIVDSPDCAFFKAELVHGSHDLSSTLLDCGGAHRILHTRNDISEIVGDRRGAMAELIDAVSASADASVVAVSTMPMATVTGVDYEQLLRLAARPGKAMLHIPSGSMSLDWLDGYARMMSELAREIELPAVPTSPDTVALIGVMVDRTEPDQLANVLEMTRLLSAMGLKTSAVWFSGTPCAELAKVAEAGTLFSLPYGREAAEVLAGRTGARVVPLELPLGLAATERWLTAVGAALGLEDRARAVIREELAMAAPRLEWIVPQWFLGRRFVLVAEPHAAQSMVALLRELGADVSAVALTAATYHRSAEEIVPGAGARPVLFEAPFSKLQALITETFSSAEPADLLIADGRLIDRVARKGIPFFEVGYPSFFSHATTDTPIYGFRGALAFASAIANRLHLAQLIGWSFGRGPSAAP
jgi:nitrogenase molybdenum-iron protein alpha/beta subunit